MNNGSRYPLLAAVAVLVAVVVWIAWDGYDNHPVTGASIVVSTTTSTAYKTPESTSTTVADLSYLMICDSDFDCVSADAGCCGCTSGGEATAVARAYREEWLNMLAPECAAIMCPAVMSNHPSCFMRPACVGGECILVPTTTSTSTTTTTPEIRCSRNTDCGLPSRERVCHLGDVYLKTVTPVCRNPTTPDSYCVEDSSLSLSPVDACRGGATYCQDGDCVVVTDS